MQPDITAPGLNILAAWTGGEAPTKLAMDHRVAQYTIESGTSMSCPHIAATAALLKAIHPSWSSAAIKSALMTTGKYSNGCILNHFLWSSRVIQLIDFCILYAYSNTLHYQSSMAYNMSSMSCCQSFHFCAADSNKSPSNHVFIFPQVCFTYDTSKFLSSLQPG